MNRHAEDLQTQRIAYWGGAYLESTRESYRRAEEFFREGDAFTAYLNLFVAFNNLYCLIARFDGHERAKIRAALKNVPAEEIDRFYTSDYVDLINSLNDGPTEQFVEGPDAGARIQGIVNMQTYFLGKRPSDCVAHIREVAPGWASSDDKRNTLQEVAASLLYTVRNNQFHAVKGPHRLADQYTLESAYRLLLPLVGALLPMAERTVRSAVRSEVTQ